MNRRIAFAVSLLCFYSLFAEAQPNQDPFVKEAIAAIDVADQSDWQPALKKYYQFNDAQLKKYVDHGYSYPQIAIAAQMAKVAKKSTDDIWAMREGKQQSWPDIAKELNIKPEDVVKDVAKIRKEIVAGKFAPKPAKLPANVKQPKEAPAPKKSTEPTKAP